MKEIASLRKMQEENPSGLLLVSKSVSYTEYIDTYLYLSGFLKNTCMLFQSKRFRSEKKDFYKFPQSAQSLSTVFTVKNESDGDLLVVFVADILKDGRVQATLILTDAAWKEVLDSKAEILRVDQLYLHILEKQLPIAA